MKTDLLDIRNCDCMDLMKEFPDKHFDLAVVDPPYGIGMGEAMGTGWSAKNGGVKHAVKTWDNTAPKAKYFNELRRVSKNQIIWGANYFIEQMPINSPCWIVWDKNNGQSLFADCELAWTSHSTPCRIIQVHWCGSAAIHETGQNKIHPTQKPIKLYNWIFANYAKPGMKILDTHMGSGSIAISAHYNVMHLTASELDSDYYNAACERIERETRQLTLF